MRCLQCGKKIHGHDGLPQGLKCRCRIRPNECHCNNPSIMFPRPCPCSDEVCQEKWIELTKNEKEEDDEDFLYFHCSCHDILLGKTSFHCEHCGQWVCQNCDTSAVLDDNQDIEFLCASCLAAELQNRLCKLKKRYAQLEEAQQKLKMQKCTQQK